MRIHQFKSIKPGPALIILGAVHGNETCGTVAIQRLIDRLDNQQLTLQCGSLTLIPICNPLAYQLKQRQGERNLNRNLRISTAPQDYEDQLANLLCPILQQHDVLLDLHSFHTAGTPFALIGPENNQGALEAFARSAEEVLLAHHLPCSRIVEGWMETYQRGVLRRRAHHPEAPTMLLDTDYGVGTTEFMRAHGGYGVTLECGQHQDPNAPELAWQAIQQTLALLQMVDIPPQPASDKEVIRLIDVIDRVHQDDYFAQTWRSFDSLQAGQLIGSRANGEAVYAPADGFIVFPNPNALPGNEWFYFAIPSPRKIPSPE